MSSESDEVVEKKAAEAEGGEVEAEAQQAEPKADAAAAEEPEAEATAKPDAEEPQDEEEPAQKEEPSASDDEETRAAPVAAEHEHSEEEAAEDDHPHNGVIGVTIITTLAAVVFSVIGVREIYRSVFDAEMEAKVLSVAPFPDLAEVRAEEKAKLGRYQWVSKKDGVVRVPLDRAVQLTVADYKERAAKAGQPKPEVTAAPTAVPEAPKPDGSAQPEAPKPPQPEAPKPEHH